MNTLRGYFAELLGIPTIDPIQLSLVYYLCLLASVLEKSISVVDKCSASIFLDIDSTEYLNTHLEINESHS